MENYYKLKSWCDAKDPKGNWCLGRIKQKKKNVIVVHFDGWSDRYKVFYCTHSTNLAPLRKYSRGYTGQPSIALREWEFNESALRADESKMSKLTSANFQSLNPYDLTSFIRGDLFIHIDCLLTYTYSNPATDIKNVESFLMRTLHFCEKWIDLVLKCEFPAKNYLNSTNDAIIACGFEIFEIIRSILGFNKRTSKYFSTYKIFTSNIEYCKIFVAGIENFYKVIEKYSVDDYWNLLYVVPLICECSGKNVESEKSALYVSCLKAAVEGSPDIVQKNEKNEFNDKVFNTLGRFVGNEKAEEIQKTIILSRKPSRDYKIEITDSSNVSIIEHEDQINSLEDEISPLKITKNTNFQVKFEQNVEIPEPKTQKPKKKIFDFEKKSPVKLPMPLILESGFSNMSHSEFANVESLINEKFDKCMETIQNIIFKQDRNLDNSLPLKEYLSGTADQNEFKVLDRLEYLLGQRDVLEALSIVRWRKKICRIALLDGWEIADKISKVSVEGLKVTTDHIIQANLKSFLMKFD